MKTTRTIILLIAVVIIAACNAVHKNTSTTTASAPAVATPSSDSYLFVKPLVGTRPPAQEELLAIQKKYKDVTMEQLNKGHEIYTAGACIGCHNAADIQEYEETQWPAILDDMAIKANLSDAEKNSVYKYILSIKATQVTR